jgi:putative phosphoesterase
MTTAGISRVAALYDVHGNLPALEAALAAARAAGADTLVFGGDVALGPMPRETVERLMELDAPARYVRGNCDRLVVDAFDGRPLPNLPPDVVETIQWTAAQLGRGHRDFLAAFEATVALSIPGAGDVLFCHGSPRDDDEIITSATPDERLRPMLAGVAQAAVVCGHSHVQFDRVVDGIRLLNAGSVGMPFAPPGAYWLLLGPGTELVRTDYGAGPAERLVRATAHPYPDTFLHRWTDDDVRRFLDATR